MNTPICDFARRYAQSGPLRLHMPGHKGVALTGLEPLDITEIDGADSLYEASGIILESERNAGSLFGADTFYSTEGSSLSIRAMLHLLCQHARAEGKRPRILAGRNAHKTFLSAAALLDFDIDWLYPAAGESYLSCAVEAGMLEQAIIAGEKPTAVYLTTPDYLGNLLDVGALADVCHRHGVLLAVDNAHGAYLKFLQPSRHPMDLGADLCCDSAHKTLPAVTGSAYLHLSKRLPPLFREQAKNALALFGSTSPSYLILQSLDAVNGYLADGYAEKLNAFTRKVYELKERLSAGGFTLMGAEPLKITLLTKPYGWTGDGLAAHLAPKGLFCEFCDRDHLVFMVTPETGAEGLARLETELLLTERKAPVLEAPPAFGLAKRAMSVRQATLSANETLEIRDCKGKVLASPSVGCPPAVPILVCGEIIDDTALQAFSYYGIGRCTVVKA